MIAISGIRQMYASAFGCGTGNAPLKALRTSANTFDLVVETNRDEILEVQGRVSGGKAFVRFIALNNLRAELAELKIERERLVSS